MCPEYGVTYLSGRTTSPSAVTVLILDGPNAGRSFTTGPDRSYQLYDLQPGSFTLRFTKPGYATADLQYFLPGDRFNGFDVTLDKL